MCNITPRGRVLRSARVDGSGRTGRMEKWCCSVNVFPMAPEGGDTPDRGSLYAECCRKSNNFYSDWIYGNRRRFDFGDGWKFDGLRPDFFIIYTIILLFGPCFVGRRAESSDFRLA